MQTNNSELLKEIQFGTKGSLLEVPRTISNMIVPTIEVNGKLVKNCRTASTSTGSTTANILVANPNADIYIISACISLIKDAAATSTGSWIGYTDEDGGSQRILQIPSITLTAQQASLSISFNHPLKIKRNTAVTLNNGTNGAVILTQANIVYFIDENSNA